MLGTSGQPLQRLQVLANLVAHRRQLVDAERPHPFGEPRQQRSDHGVVDLEPAEERGGVLVAGVGGDGRVHGDLEDLEFGHRAVHGDDHGVGAGAVFGGHRPRLDAAHVVLVEQRRQAGRLGARPLHRGREVGSMERLVDVGNAPARERIVDRR